MVIVYFDVVFVVFFLVGLGEVWLCCVCGCKGVGGGVR